ncbi:hypothetical protein [Streptomyces pseudogriseolus]|uniref:hypothetical protein n=1 Tax=Streptomyces pseudogriseolus TaxID=36817 RepID=UPI003FA2C540
MSELFDAVDAVDARLASRAALPPPAERERLRAAHGLKIDEVATALKVLATAQKMRRATVSGRENGKTEPRPPERDAHAAAGQARGALPSRRRCRAGAAPAPAEAQTSSTGQASEAADALNPLHGDQVRRLHTALRSFFRALKRERLIFRDPARTISLTSNRSVPTALPSDRIAGLLDRLDDPRDRLMVALVGIYALIRPSAPAQSSSFYNEPTCQLAA